MSAEPRMNDQKSDPPAGADAGAGGLRRNSMTWVGAALLGAIIMSPASGLYFNFTPIEATAGRVVPLIFLIAIVVTLPTALSYAALSRSLPSAGSAYTWVRRAIGPNTGVFAGWILNGFYLLSQIVLPGIGALFFNDILGQIGLPTGYFTWAIGVLVMTGIVAAINYRGIDLSLKGTVIFMVLESVVVFALMLTIFIVQSGNGSFTGSDVASTFTPSAATGGAAAIFFALVFGIQANVGFDAVFDAGRGDAYVASSTSRSPPSSPWWRSARTGWSPRWASWPPSPSSRWSTSWPTEAPRCRRWPTNSGAARASC